MEPPFQSVAVANRFVEIANESGSKDLSLMKLLKVVYFAHGWHLALAKKPLIDEQIEAWKFGPVAPDVYRSFRDCALHIKTPAQILENCSMDAPLNLITPTLRLEEPIESFFKKIWDIYGKLTAYQLSALTHKDGTPWYKTWYELGGSQCRGTDISNELIQSYFEQKMTVSANVV